MSKESRPPGRDQSLPDIHPLLALPVQLEARGMGSLWELPTTLHLH